MSRRPTCCRRPALAEPNGRFPQLLAGHRTDWVHLWERLSIEFDDFTDELRILRLHLLHCCRRFHQRFRPRLGCRRADCTVRRIAATSSGRAVHLPSVNLRLPMITRSLLRYRYRRLPGGRHAAAAAGYAGAISRAVRQRRARGKSTAAPQSAQRSVEPRLQRSRTAHRHRRRLQRVEVLPGHRGSRVLIDYGAEMLAEIARFFVSRATHDEERDRYSIRGVIGPMNSTRAIRARRTTASTTTHIPT